MTQAIEQPYQSAKAAEFFNDAALAAADYASKTAARNLAFARKIAERSGEWQKFAPPEAAEIKQTASDYLTFAREAVEDFVQASERHFALLERIAENAAADGQTFFPPQAEAFGRQWASGVKAANTAMQDGVRASCRLAADSLGAADKTENAKSPGKSGKK